MINFSRFGNELGISYHTAQIWLSLLEASFIVFRLPPYYTNFKKRIIKSSKLYFYDTGIASYLLGIRETADIDSHFAKGALFENLIISELYKHKVCKGGRPEFYFWRDSTGNEIDCIYQEGTELFTIEIKSGKTIHTEFFKGLEYFSKLNTTSGLRPFLIYGGNDIQKRQNFSIAGWNRLNEVFK